MESHPAGVRMDAAREETVICLECPADSQSEARNAVTITGTRPPARPRQNLPGIAEVQLHRGPQDLSHWEES